MAKPRKTAMMIRAAHLGEASYIDADTEDNAKVYVKAHITVGVAFGQLAKASIISGEPVVKTFHDLLIPAVVGVLTDAKAVHDAAS
jgi:hypothetical protein